jgi:Response regulators consisting of a CheY-like receiver domain and a winged-helix DNA-binding domain
MKKENPHILIVDDDEDGSNYLRLLLNMEGYRITVAQSVAQALELTELTYFDLYLMDTRLPDGSGIDLCKHLREKDGRVPVVFFSGAAFEKDKKLAYDSGAQAYIVKPAIPGQLEEVVARFIWKADDTV